MRELVEVGQVEVIEDEALFLQMSYAHTLAEDKCKELHEEQSGLEALQKKRGKAKGRARRIDEIEDRIVNLAKIPDVRTASSLFESMTLAIDKSIAEATIYLEEFAEGILAYPLHTLEWKTAEAAKQAQLRKSAKLLRGMLEQHASKWNGLFNAFIQESLRQIIQYTHSPNSRSTSASCNLTEDAQVSAHSALITDWGYTFFHKVVFEYNFLAQYDGVIYEDREVERTKDE